MLRKVANPPNPYLSSHVEWLDSAPDTKLHVFEEHSRSIVTSNDSPDVGFNFSVNPYRGCFHGCAYCYARPTHQYLDMGAGTDFARKIVVKVNAAGIPVGIALAPVIPGLNDKQIPEILERGAAAGAKSAFMTLVRLPLEVKHTFIETLEAEFPTSQKRVLNELLNLRNGVLNNAQFKKRMIGEGPRWEALRWMFKESCKKLGLNKESITARLNTFSRPGQQLGLGIR